MNKVKSIFFPAIFGIMYLAFVAALVYAIYMIFAVDVFQGFVFLSFLSIQWMVLIAARFMAKRAATGNHRPSHTHYNRR